MHVSRTAVACASVSLAMLIAVSIGGGTARTAFATERSGAAQSGVVDCSVTFKSYSGGQLLRGGAVVIENTLTAAGYVVLDRTVSGKTATFGTEGACPPAFLVYITDGISLATSDAFTNRCSSDRQRSMILGVQGMCAVPRGPSMAGGLAAAAVCAEDGGVVVKTAFPGPPGEAVVDMGKAAQRRYGSQGRVVLMLDNFVFGTASGAALAPGDDLYTFEATFSDPQLAREMNAAMHAEDLLIGGKVSLRQLRAGRPPDPPAVAPCT